MKDREFGRRPLCPHKRTFVSAIAMPVGYQKRTWVVAKTPHPLLFDKPHRRVFVLVKPRGTLANAFSPLRSAAI